MLARLKVDPFVLALLVVVAAAVAWPTPGETGGPLHAEKVASYGIGLIFLLYGISLSPEQMWRSMGKWREHLLVQAATFLLFPAIVFAVQPLTGHVFQQDVLTGLFFLAALPSTVSSSVAMTSLARGNVPLAIFNASISSFIGVFATPVLLAWYLHATGASLPLSTVILKLVLLVLLPIAVGQFLRPLAGPWVARHKVVVRVADRAVILAIVYNSFCDSVAGGVWSSQDIWTLPILAGAVIGLFLCVYGILDGICRLVGLKVEDRIAVLFCGSKKSLATGLPMAGIIFGTGPATALIIAPVMMFHFFQLLIVSFIAASYARRPEEGIPAPQEALPERKEAAE
ncbi:bile acid:sodium symporter family protein [Aquabacter cavernae]|uniref:bile acid:sodium symporter family protein n=1 Tax=Aquabacter cavernae TaxID=2496029 RepID=UPI000F8F4164|nr:bile acid:sodium symporter family protein [Aquabacter cavernae]